MARRGKDNQVDWDVIERNYRLGTKSNKQLGGEFDVDHSSIGRRAKKFGWVVDKSKEVVAVTNSLLIQNASGNANPNATPSALEIKVAATVASDMVLKHRKGLVRIGCLRDNLLGELEAITDNKEAFGSLAKLLDESGPDATGTWRKDKLNEIYRKVIALNDRIDNTKKLTEIDEKLRKGEREAFGVDAPENKSDTVVDMLKNIGRKLRAEQAALAA